MSFLSMTKNLRFWGSPELDKLSVDFSSCWDSVLEINRQVPVCPEAQCPRTAAGAARSVGSFGRWHHVLNKLITIPYMGHSSGEVKHTIYLKRYPLRRPVVDLKGNFLNIESKLFDFQMIKRVI